MRVRPARVALGVCSIVAAWAQAQPSRPPTQTELDKAVDEFRTQSRLMGMRADSPVRVRQGWWKAWHGRLFDNARNDAFDAVPHEIRQRGGDKSLLQRHQFGFHVGGPVYRQRTFLSVSYEGMRERISRSFLNTVPTLGERLGNFGGTVDPAGNPLPIYDPATTRLNSAFDPTQPVSNDNLQYLRDPFPANAMPASRLDSAALAGIRKYPLPNTSVGPFDRNNYFVVSPETNRANGVILKLDHNLDDRHRLAWSATLSDGFAGSARLFPLAPEIDPNPSDREFSTRRVSLTYTTNFSPNSVNTASFNASGDRSSAALAEGQVPCAAYRFGIYLGICRSDPASLNANDNYTWSDSLSLKRGKHSVSLSGNLNLGQVNVFAPQYPAGEFSFGEGLTSLPGIVNTGHPFASYLLGLAQSAESSVVPSPSYFRRQTAYVSLGERYELRSNLAVSFALGLNLSTPRVEKYDHQSTVDLNAVDPATGRRGILVAAGRGGYGRAFQPFHARTEPSASLAWNPRGDTRGVVRFSVARSYQVIPVYSAQWGTQGFKLHPTYISENSQLDPAVKLAAGLPPLAGVLPDLSPRAADSTYAELVEPTGRQPSYNYAGLSFERQLPASLILTVGAAYSSGRDLLVGSSSVNPDAILLDALAYRDQLNDESFRAGLRPYPQYLGFDVDSNYPAGRYQRDAAYLRVDKRTSSGLTVAATYEFSKQMDDYSGPYGTQDYLNRSNEWSLTSWNAPHRLSVTYGYELPFGVNKALLAYSDWRRYLVEGWSISGMSSLASGDPIAPRPLFNNTGGLIPALRVNVVPGVDVRPQDQGPLEWFNPAAFDQPADFTPGNGSRTVGTVLTPGNQNHDLAVSKRFSLAPERTVELSAMGLNFLNHANWNDPDMAIGPASAPNVNAGRIIGSRGGRILQIGLRYSF